MKKPTAADYRKVLNNLKIKRKEAQLTLKEIDRKISKANELIKDIRVVCRHEYEYIICTNPTDPREIDEEQFKINLPHFMNKIKIDNTKLIFSYRGGNYEELLKFFGYYEIMLKCSKCGDTLLLSRDCEEEINFVIKAKIIKKKKK